MKIGVYKHLYCVYLKTDDNSDGSLCPEFLHLVVAFKIDLDHRVCCGTEEESCKFLLILLLKI